jgi:hypothetical protein
VAAKPLSGTGGGLPGGAGSGAAGTPVAVPVRDYAVWSVWEKERMKGRSFRPHGFRHPRQGRRLVRVAHRLNCCVADGTAFMVEVRGQQAPPKNQWVTVTGEWAEPTKRPDGDVAALTGTAVQVVEPPANQYE